MCSIKYKRIAYFSKEALDLMVQGDEEMQEFFKEYLNRQMSHADVRVFYYFDFIDT